MVCARPINSFLEMKGMIEIWSEKVKLDIQEKISLFKVLDHLEIQSC